MQSTNKASPRGRSGGCLSARLPHTAKALFAGGLWFELPGQVPSIHTVGSAGHRNDMRCERLAEVVKGLVHVGPLAVELVPGLGGSLYILDLFEHLLSGLRHCLGGLRALLGG